MINDALSIVGRSISSAVLWFETLISSIDAVDIVMGSIILGVVGRRLLKPIFGEISDEVVDAKLRREHRKDGE